MRHRLTAMFLCASLVACKTAGPDGPVEAVIDAERSSPATDLGVCSDLDLRGTSLSLKPAHAKHIAGTEWVGRWCDPRLQGTHNDPKGKLVRRFIKLSDTAHDKGVLVLESFFHGVRGVRRWPTEEGRHDLGYIAEGKLTFVTATKPWYLAATRTDAGCIAFTWQDTLPDSRAVRRNYVQNCEPKMVAAVTAE